MIHKLIQKVVMFSSGASIILLRRAVSENTLSLILSRFTRMFYGDFAKFIGLELFII